MKFDSLLEKYTEEYKKYIGLGLSKEDAITLIEKHIKENIDIRTMSPYDLITLFAGEDVWKKTFDAFDAELDNLIKEVTKIMKPEKKESKVTENTLEQCDAPLVEKTCECVKREGVKPLRVEEYKNNVKKEIIADTPKHKEFRVTYPNGYYKYKMLMK